MTLINKIIVKYLFENNIMLKFVRNYYKENSISFKECINKYDTVFGGSFIYKNTPEGYGFWHNHKEKLIKEIGQKI